MCKLSVHLFYLQQNKQLTQNEKDLKNYKEQLSQFEVSSLLCHVMLCYYCYHLGIFLGSLTPLYGMKKK